MAVPKRKVSRSRRGMRRSHHKLQALSTSSCANCGNVKLPHRVCLSCGYHKGVEVTGVAKES